MSIGVWRCSEGGGSPFKHQNLIWVNNMVNCLNFASVKKPRMRQKLAFVALGVTLPVSYYTTIRNVDPVVDMEIVEQGQT